MNLVGIIANPASGKDIRRVVSSAFVVNNQQKVNIVRRLLLSLLTGGVDQVAIMPDHYGIGERALHELEQQMGISDRVSVIDMPIVGTQDDSTHAANYLREAGAGCIVVLGGDGTCRAVSKGCGEVPLLPISTGTNNVVPAFIEGTIAGLAAAFVARHPDLDPREIGDRHKKLLILVNGEQVDQALVDVAVVAGHLTGAKAVWGEDVLLQVFAARAQPTNIGISAIIGMHYPVLPGDPYGAVTLLKEDGLEVMVPIAPGLIKQIGISPVEKLLPGAVHPIVNNRPVVLALDGERERVLLEQDTAGVLLQTEGPWIVDVERVMNRVAARAKA